jgi:hypothetical protein
MLRASDVLGLKSFPVVSKVPIACCCACPLHAKLFWPGVSLQLHVQSIRMEVKSPAGNCVLRAGAGTHCLQRCGILSSRLFCNSAHWSRFEDWAPSCNRAVWAGVCKASCQWFVWLTVQQC